MRIAIYPVYHFLDKLKKSKNNSYIKEKDIKMKKIIKKKLQECNDKERAISLPELLFEINQENNTDLSIKELSKYLILNIQD